MRQKHVNESTEKAELPIASCESSLASNRPFQCGLHPIHQLQRILGNRNVAQLIQAKRLTPEGNIVGLQRKLTVGAADDQYEQEADRVARQVVNAPDAAASTSVQREISPENDEDKMLQPKPLAASITPLVPRQMVNPEEEKRAILAKSAGSTSGNFEVGGDVETQISQRKGRGSPLPDPVRAYMEPRFGADFSQVRVHTGSNAIRMNRDVGAQAFTNGSEIYFGAGSDPTNLELTAHELTHTLQQGASKPMNVDGVGASGVRHVGVNCSTLLQRDAAAPPPMAGTSEVYTLTLSDGVHANVSKVEALALLSDAAQSLLRGVDQNSGEYALVNKSRLSFFGAIGGALTDLAGKSFPTYEETWAGVYNGLDEARRNLRAQNVQGAADQLVTANAAYEKGKAKWYAYKAQIDDAGTRAQIGIGVVAVVAIAAIATGGAALAAAPAEAGAGGAGAGAGGAAVIGGGVGGEVALGATAPIAVGISPLATTGVVSGGGAVVGGGVGGAVALGSTVPVAAAGGAGAAAAGAAGTVTVVGVGGATADAIVGAAIADASAALTTGGTAAATATAEGMSVGLLEAVYGNLFRLMALNAPLLTTEARALKVLADVVFEVWRRKLGFPPGGY